MSQGTRLNWLQQQIAVVENCIIKDNARLAKKPDDRATQLSLASWKSQMQGYIQELNRYVEEQRPSHGS